MFARVPITQTIELFDYDVGDWEVIDSRTAPRFNDLTVTIELTGDLSRFVEPGTRCMEARIRFRGATQRAQFRSNTDRAIWITVF